MTAEPAAVTFYWRPGCGFCARLEHALARLEVPLRHRNIWEDPEAAAFVRSVARGNETVPTVAVGPAALVNPSPAEVLAAVADHAPHLLRRSCGDGSGPGGEPGQ